VKRIFAFASLAFAIVASTLFAVARQDRFDHADHANLFPVCTSCHAGIESGDAAALYPTAADCARCHNGKTRREVEWKGPVRVATNLKFSHEVHQIECSSCHAKNGATERMQVARAKPEACFECHTPENQPTGPVVHLAATSECTMCHVPVKDARALAQQQIADFPQPPSHKEPGFLAGHKQATVTSAATCAVCHTKESCSRCHANAGSVKVIASLGSDERVAGLVASKKAVYPKPADHQRANFAAEHGTLAQSGIETCANCHTRDGCQQCHSGSSAADQLARLPVRVAGLAPGVALKKSSARTAHPPGFANAHGTTAGANSESCTSCHQQKFCSDCHQGADSRRFHPANFSSRHSDAVYSGDGECASCHNRESFCQTCHTGLGLNSTGQRTTTFHTSQSIWLLQHGQPARQNMESCASCHTQSSCTRCHATNGKGGWGVSPHGSMNASKLKDKNQVVCVRCHLSGTL
jgi:predicted CXXCH cytochrome family protein